MNGFSMNVFVASEIARNLLIMFRYDFDEKIIENTSYLVSLASIALALNSVFVVKMFLSPDYRAASFKVLFLSISCQCINDKLMFIQCIVLTIFMRVQLGSFHDVHKHTHTYTQGLESRLERLLWICDRSRQQLTFSCLFFFLLSACVGEKFHRLNSSMSSLFHVFCLTPFEISCFTSDASRTPA